MKGVQWVFFDVGSTLVDETEAYNHRIREMIAGTGVSFEAFQQKQIEFARQNLRGDSEAIKFFGLQKTPWHPEDEVPYPDAEPVLRYLRQKGFKLGIIANQSPGTAQRLESWGLLRHIDVVAASAELGVAKPDPKIFLQAFQMAGCRAQEAVMVGDRLDNDIEPAKKLGMKAIWVKQGPSACQCPKDSDCTPDFTVEKLTGLRQLF